MASHSLPDCVPDDCDATIRRAVQYWLSIHPAEGLPGRQHLDPVDIPDLLCYVQLVEFSSDPLKFRNRLMGTASVNFFGKDYTGFWYHEAFSDFAGSAAEALFAKVVETNQPGWRRGPPACFKPKDFMEIECAVLPLATNGCNTDMLLFVHVPD